MIKFKQFNTDAQTHTISHSYKHLITHILNTQKCSFLCVRVFNCTWLWLWVSLIVRDFVCECPWLFVSLIVSVFDWECLCVFVIVCKYVCVVSLYVCHCLCVFVGVFVCDCVSLYVYHCACVILCVIVCHNVGHCGCLVIFDFQFLINYAKFQLAFTKLG